MKPKHFEVTSSQLESGAAWKVEMTPKTGHVETMYFDKTSGLLVRMATIMTTPLGDIPADMIFSDYRLLNGIQTPFAMTQDLGAVGRAHCQQGEMAG